MACFTMNQLGYIGTGYNGTNAMTDFWEYNTSTDTWTTKALFLAHRVKMPLGLP
ncbi:MAG: hypothetical protein HWD58_08570 [Bacteroidota bacterium]|nr:MAG: hypothetical protein HWD58_08570 [Bacteroidota bacterium]